MTEGALVLEGGSLRGVFSAGVLDVFMEQGIDPAGKGKLCFLSFQLHRHGTLRFLTAETIELHRSARLSFVTDCDGSGKFLADWKQIGDDYVVLRHFLFVDMDGPGNLSPIPFSLFGEDLAARDTACCRLRADQ